LKEKKRIDGRTLNEIRVIQTEVGVLPRTHGSALFSRGETQSLVLRWGLIPRILTYSLLAL
ncbi:MAG: hypothetical protein Q8850_02590, partial [Candidatus Phytoplasma australasiaticum]|nr:hypothetical protein [Candidatus Phytoplasma australasiaticum]